MMKPPSLTPRWVPAAVSSGEHPQLSAISCRAQLSPGQNIHLAGGLRSPQSLCSSCKSLKKDVGPWLLQTRVSWSARPGSLVARIAGPQQEGGRCRQQRAGGGQSRDCQAGQSRPGTASVCWRVALCRGVDVFVYFGFQQKSLLLLLLPASSGSPSFPLLCLRFVLRFQLFIVFHFPLNYSAA